MGTTRTSDCGRFVVVTDLYLDRRIFRAASRWADLRGLSFQDAIQLALCALTDAEAEAESTTPRDRGRAGPPSDPASWTSS